MLTKLGIDISRLSRPVRSKLGGIDEIFTLVSGREAVITSTCEGNHMASSLHYANDAIDFRLPAKVARQVAEKLREYLGKGFDVVVEVDHIHVEYDPKKKGV